MSVLSPSVTAEIDHEKVEFGRNGSWYVLRGGNGERVILSRAGWYAAIQLIDRLLQATDNGATAEAPTVKSTVPLTVAPPPPSPPPPALPTQVCRECGADVERGKWCGHGAPPPDYQFVDSIITSLMTGGRRP